MGFLIPMRGNELASMAFLAACIRLFLIPMRSNEVRRGRSATTLPDTGWGEIPWSRPSNEGIAPGYMRRCGRGEREKESRRTWP